MDRSKKRFVAAYAVRTVLFLLVLFSSSACITVGPDYVRPEMPVPDTWQKEIVKTSGSSSGGDALSDWWKTFNDPVLSGLIERAMANNLDLTAALSRVRESRARLGITSADRFPSVNATGSATRSYSSGQMGGATNLGGSFPQGSIDQSIGSTTSDGLSARLDASWQLDIFGGVRRSLEAAKADLESTQEAYHDVLVTLLADLAQNYVNLRSYQKQLSVAEANLNLQEETLNITTWRYQSGLSTELDVEKATYNLESTRAQIPAIKTSLSQAENRIAVLLGEHPGALLSELEKETPMPEAPPSIAIGIPADLLRRRPDLRKAERDLAAQTARIGAAKADLYPKFSLTGSLGIDEFYMSGIHTENKSYSIAPGISWTVFKAGAIMKNIEVQTVVQEQKLIQYKKTLLTALEDVENALSSYTNEMDRKESLSKASKAAESAVAVSKNQYSSGLVDFNTVLEAERSLYNFQNQLVQSDAGTLTSLIGLYKALGGGWKEQLEITN